jgi:hypothetical protein
MITIIGIRGTNITKTTNSVIIKHLLPVIGCPLCIPVGPTPPTAAITTAGGIPPWYPAGIAPIGTAAAPAVWTYPGYAGYAEYAE